MRRVLEWLFPPTFWAQVMLGVFLLVAFFLPGLLGFALWPEAGQSDYWKILSILSGGSLFVALKATYMYFTLLLVERESRLGMYD